MFTTNNTLVDTLGVRAAKRFMLYSLLVESNSKEIIAVDPKHGSAMSSRWRNHEFYQTIDNKFENRIPSNILNIQLPAKQGYNSLKPLRGLQQRKCQTQNNLSLNLQITK